MSWPLLDLRLSYEEIVLGGLDDATLFDLAPRACGNVLGAHQRGWMGEWTQRPRGEFEWGVYQYHWGVRASWTPASWTHSFAVLLDGRAEGVMTIGADDWHSRVVSTGSWLLPEARGRKVGRRMRAMAVQFAFDHLGAVWACSDAHPDNAASNGVSRSLGYVENGVRRSTLDEQVVTAQHWLLLPEALERLDGLQVRGFDACRELFGLVPRAD